MNSASQRQKKQKCRKTNPNKTATVYLIQLRDNELGFACRNIGVARSNLQNLHKGTIVVREPPPHNSFALQG